MTIKKFNIGFNATAWVILVAALAVNIFASLALRGLYADGSAFLLSMIQAKGSLIWDPSRRTVHILQQLPSVMCMRYIHNAGKLAVIYSLTTQLLPLAFLTATFFLLPRDHKKWFFFPLLCYLAGSMGAAFVPILEGPVATAYFWLLLYLILFQRDKRFSLPLTVLLALPTLYTHEVMSFLAPLLALSTIWRASKSESRTECVVFWLLAVWFTVVAAVQIGFVINPTKPANRDFYIYDLLHLNWLIRPDGYTNVPVVLGMLSLIVMPLLWMSGFSSRDNPWSKGFFLSIIVCLGLASLLAIIGTIYCDRLFVPWMQFSARNHPAFVSVPLALLAIASLRWPRLQIAWSAPFNRVILLTLAAGTLGWHVVATAYWSDYVKTYRDLLARYQGLTRYEDVLANLPQDQQYRFNAMTWSWTNPTVSVLLSPGGKVSTLIANSSEYSGWQPFDPTDPGSLPKTDWFDFSAYRRNIEQARHSSTVSNAGR